MDNLFICHQQLREVVGRGAESFKVVRCTEAHRAYWRPHRVRVMLLAESHVFTSSDDLTRRVCRFPEGKSIPTDMPADFVRLVYCLGYGENGLLDQPFDSPRRNPGTTHFWKIFYSCINRIGTSEDFGPILKKMSRTSNSERIRNKVSLLRELQKRGVWLVDASLVALYPRCLSSAQIKEILETSWDRYVGSVVREARPDQIVCIGRGVARYLDNRLQDLRIPFAVLPQPNARLAREEHLETIRRYYDLVNG